MSLGNSNEMKPVDVSFGSLLHASKMESREASQEAKKESVERGDAFSTLDRDIKMQIQAMRAERVQAGKQGDEVLKRHMEVLERFNLKEQAEAELDENARQMDAIVDEMQSRAEREMNEGRMNRAERGLRHVFDMETKALVDQLASLTPEERRNAEVIKLLLTNYDDGIANQDVYELYDELNDEKREMLIKYEAGEALGAALQELDQPLRDQFVLSEANGRTSSNAMKFGLMRGVEVSPEVYEQMIDDAVLDLSWIQSDRMQLLMEAVPHLPEEFKGVLAFEEMFSKSGEEDAFAELQSLDRGTQLRVLELVSRNNFNISAAGLKEAEFSQPELLAVALQLAEKDAEAFLSFAQRADIELGWSDKMGIARRFAEKNNGASFKATVEAFQCSSDQTRELFSSIPEPQRADMLAQFEMAGGSISLQEAMTQGQVRGPETGLDATRAEQLRERLETIGQKLSAAIVEAYPERAAREAERSKAENELRGNMVEVKTIGGSLNSPLRVAFEGRLMPAVYKPLRREYGLRHDEGFGKRTREGIDPTSVPNREWLAGQIDRALGLDLVPATIVRDGPDGLGTVQDWKIGAPGSKASWQTAAKEIDLMNLSLFDALVQNTDRHDNNFLVDPSGRVVAIDNALILASGDPDKNPLRSWPLERFENNPVPPELRGHIDRLRAAPKVAAALRDAFRAALGEEEGNDAWDLFQSRAELLAPQNQSHTGRFPKPKWRAIEEKVKIKHKDVAPQVATLDARKRGPNTA